HTHAPLLPAHTHGGLDTLETQSLSLLLPLPRSPSPSFSLSLLLSPFLSLTALSLSPSLYLSDSLPLARSLSLSLSLSALQLGAKSVTSMEKYALRSPLLSSPSTPTVKPRQQELLQTHTQLRRGKERREGERVCSFFFKLSDH